MRRIIQRYQEGGVVRAAPQPEMSVMPVQTNQNSQQPQETHWDTLEGIQSTTAPLAVKTVSATGIPRGTTGPLAVGPVVATGIPQGGYAKQAIADYLAGKSLGDPLSYVAGQSNVPDYRALADALGPRFGSSQPDAVASEDGNTEHSDMMSGSQDFTTEDVLAAYEDLVSNNDPNVISSFEAGSGAEDHSAFMSSANQNYADNVLNNTGYTPAQIAALNPAYNADLAKANQTGLVDGVTNLLGGDDSNGVGTLAEAGIRNVGGSSAQNGDNYGLPMEYMVVNSSDGSSQVFGPNNTVFDSIVDASVHSSINNSGASGGNAGDIFSPGATFAGGGVDDQGNLGLIGDIGGGLAEALGLVPEDYDWGANKLDGLAGLGQAGVTQDAAATGKVGGVLSNLNLTGPVVIPTRTLDTSGGTQTADGLTFTNTYTGGYSAGDHPTNQGGSTARKEAIQAGIDKAARDAAIAVFGSEQLWLNAGSPMLNNGGSVGPLAQRYNNGSTGGVTTAKSGIREEEIRERQRMQARLPDVKASPISGIGEKLAMGAVNNGINTGLATMAGKEGLMGTLGTMMGSGGVGATAGTGMMSALGPIGIGIGLGKMFGLFNDGGKVPCSCGKTPCKCAKRKKSPLSGE